MPLIVLRCVCFLLAAGLAGWLANSREFIDRPDEDSWFAAGVLLLAIVAAILFDLAVPRKNLRSSATVYGGLLAGLVLALALNAMLQTLPLPAWLATALPSALAIACSYCCISALLQTLHQFRSPTPITDVPPPKTVELHPCLLDTSAIIDGRIADVVETKVLDNPLVVPAFVLAELQGIADSSDRLRRTRGRRGLDILNRLRDNAAVNLRIHEQELADTDGQPVDQKLVLLAKQLGGKVVTGDYNLNKVAQLHGVDVVNLNDLAIALRPAFMPGEALEVYLVKGGEEPGQAVGYLDDGTMVVVESAREKIHQTVKVTVTSVLQTSAGRMIFGR
jgi:uncharacterized protein YacL